MNSRAVFERFLSRPVPPTGTKDWNSWQRECQSFGTDVADVAVHALEHGSENEQYAAALALRTFGYEVEAEGYDIEMMYRIRSTAEEPWRAIEPKVKPEPYVP